MPWWQQPFFQVSLPIIVTFILATWYRASRINDVRDSLGKGIDDLCADMNTRFAAVEKRLDKLEDRMENLQERSWR